MSEFHYPRFLQWVRTQIYLLSYEKLPVTINVENLSINFFTLSASFDDIQIEPKKELADVIAPIKIKRLYARLDPLQLIFGHFVISDIYLKNPDVIYFYKPSKKADNKKIELPSFDELYDLPVNKIRIENANLLSRIDEYDQSLQVKDLNLEIKKGFRSILAKVDSPQIRLKKKLDQESLTYFSLDLKTHIESEKIILSEFKLAKEDSFVVAVGEVDGDIFHLKVNNADLRGKVKLDLTDVREWILAYNKKIQLPEMTGIVSSEIQVLPLAKTPTIFAKNKFENLKIDHFNIGGGDFDLSLNSKKVESKKLRLVYDTQDIEVTNASMALTDKMSFSGNVKVKGFELRSLLLQLGIGDTPLLAKATGELPCKGEVQPKFQVRCDGSVNVSELLVHGDKKEHKIVHLKNFSAKGSLSVDKDFFQTKADLKLGNATGKADAIIDFSKGFTVNYQSDNFSFDDVISLADLKMAGKGSLKGRTYGNSHTAAIELDANIKNFWFEDLSLGDIQTPFLYSSSILSLKNIKGHLKNSDYKGFLNVDLKKERMTLDLNFPNMSLADLKSTVEKKIPLPVEMQGYGSMHLNINGPYDTRKLNLTAKGQFNRATIAGETLDVIHVEAQGVNGLIKSQNTYAIKDKSKAYAELLMRPQEFLKIKASGNNFYLSESENVQKYLPSLTGQVDFKLDMAGKWGKPETTLEVDLKESAIGSIPLKKSEFNMTFFQDHFTSTMNLFEKQIVGEVNYPYEKGLPLELEMQTNNWDYAPLLSAISNHNEKDGFAGSMNSKIKLASPNGDIWSASGSYQIEKFELSRGPLQLHNRKPINMRIQQGRIETDTFDLVGDDSFLKVRSSANAKNPLSLNINGRMNMGLLAFLTPFLSDLRGNLTFNSQILASKNNFEILGSANVREGYVKLYDFPHPFENIDSDILFSKNKIVINSLRSELATGQVRASGSITMNSYKDVPIQIDGTISNAKLEVPKGVQLKTSGNFLLHGKWFPYLLTSNMIVNQGLVTKTEGKSTQKLQQSRFLPKIVKAEGFEPLLFDINAKIQGENLRILNDFIDTKLKGNLKISGSASNPRIAGDLTLAERGQIFFKDHIFTVDNTNIRFANEEEVNPEIYLTAQSRVQEYDIQMTVEGRLNQIKPSFSSQPSLSDGDIITLLTLGYTQSSNTLATTTMSGENANNNNSQAVELGTAILNQNPLNKSLQNKTGFTFKFNTAVDDADANVAVPRVEVSKKWNPKLETSASRTFGKTLKNDAKVQYKINDKVSVIGSWEAQTSTEGSTTTLPRTNDDVFGLDLEYKIEFR